MTSSRWPINECARHRWRHELCNGASGAVGGDDVLRMRVVLVPVYRRDDRLLAVHGRATVRRQQHYDVAVSGHVERTLAQLCSQTYVSIVSTKTSHDRLFGLASRSLLLSFHCLCSSAQSTVKILLLPVSWNKRPPCWNSTFGFNFYLRVIIVITLCINLPNFIQIGPPTAELWRHSVFQDGGYGIAFLLPVSFFVSSLN